MSRSVDLFIDSARELADVAERLGKLIGTPFQPSGDGQRFVLTEGPTVAYLGRHRFVDDGDLPFSRYAYTLSARVPAGTAVADSAELALLRHVAELFRLRTSVPVLLVHDLQYRDRATPAPAAGHGPPGDLGAPAAAADGYAGAGAGAGDADGGEPDGGESDGVAPEGGAGVPVDTGSARPGGAR